MTKKQRAKEIIEALKTEYPDSGCSLVYSEPWKLLVSVRLAAQCTDARVNVVVEKLYEKYPDVKSLADADVDKIEEIVRPCGLGRSKAKDISACMKILRDKYDCNVPKTFEEKQMQRALLQYRYPENYKLVEKALTKAGRLDLIGFGPNCLIRPKGAKENGKNFGRKSSITKNKGRAQSRGGRAQKKR